MLTRWQTAPYDQQEERSLAGGYAVTVVKDGSISLQIFVVHHVPFNVAGAANIFRQMAYNGKS